MTIDPELLDILACPQCKGVLTFDAAAGTFTCPACRLRYRVKDGIANFLIDEAEKL